MYVKLFTSIYQGTLRGNSAGLLVFTNLLAHADKNGEVDIHPKAIAEEVGMPLDVVGETLLMLESPDDESRSPEEQGRRIIRMDEHRAWGWRVVNYAKYRAMRNEDERRAQNREAQARWRNKQNKPPSAEVSHEKPPSAHAEAEAEAETKREARKRAITPARPDDVTDGTWADWLQLRKAKRAPVTKTVVDGARKEAEKAGMALEDFLQVWCRRGSQGMEAAWIKPEDRRHSGETAYQKSQRERVAEFAPGVAKRNFVDAETKNVTSIESD